MKILYLTTALRDEDYNALLHLGVKVTNPSNQNFHTKMIKAIASVDEVTVVSLIRFPTNQILLFDSGNYHYVPYPDDYFERIFLREKAVTKTAMALKAPFDVVVYDPLNRSIARAIPALAKRMRVPSMAILTDNPKNLSRSPFLYRKSVFSSVRKATAVLALSDGLLAAFHVQNKMHFITPGLVEESLVSSCPLPQGSYLYFAGALAPRYGINDLLRAYQATHPDYDLVIAGHSQHFKVPKEEPRIRFLGQVTKNENEAYESAAALCINPRPYDEKLDRESVPSKVLEYLASGRPVLSTFHTQLHELFPDDVNWLPASQEETLTEFFRAHLDAKKHFVGLQPNHAHARLFAQFGLAAQGERIHRFLVAVSSASKPSITLEKSK